MNFNIKQFRELPSTNDYLKELLKSSDLQSTGQTLAIIAEKQTKGKGRGKRAWSAEMGGLYVSLLLSVSKDNTQRLQLLTFAASLAVVDTIKEHSSLQPKIKWPNDILIGNKKICGILTESVFNQSEHIPVILGIGLNVNQASFQVSQPATSIFLETKKQSALKDIQKTLLKKLSYYVEWHIQKQHITIIKEWKKHSCTLGKTITSKEQNKTVKGEAIDVDLDGRLRIRTTDGRFAFLA